MSFDEKRRFRLHIELMNQSNLNVRKKQIIPITHSKKYILGRSLDSADIILNDPRASRSHFEIKLINNQIWIRDLNTKNGTFVNSINIINKELQKGDMITVGNHIITIKRIERVFDCTEPTAQFLNPLIQQKNRQSQNSSDTTVTRRWLSKIVG